MALAATAGGSLSALGVRLGPRAANYGYDLTKSCTPMMWTTVPFPAVAALLHLSFGPYPDLSKQEATARW